MSSKLLPRAKVRLRLDRGTALLKQFGATSLMCSIQDISEGGCQCRVTLEEVDGETATNWREILAPGRVLTLEVTEPPELRGLNTAEAEVRWMRPNKAGHIDFGMALRDLRPDQIEVLQRAMLSLASNKLRGRKPSEAETRLTNATRSSATARQESGMHATAGSVTQTGRFTTGSHARLSAAYDESVPPPPPPPPPMGPRVSGMHPLRRTPAVAGIESGPKRIPSGIRDAATDPPPATPADANKRDMEISALERQKRHALQLPIHYQFCDAEKKLVDDTMYHGRTVDFNEGGFLLEGLSTDRYDPLQLPSKNIYMMSTVVNQSQEIACMLVIRSVRQGNLAPGIYQFGVQIHEIRDEDRRMLREMYIRAGLTTLFRR
jgi:hypothetical protein